MEEKQNLFLTVKEVAELLRVHKNTVYNWIRSGNLRAFKVGRQWHIHRQDLWNHKENARCLNE